MTYQRSIGEQLKSYLGDISGVSDVFDEWTAARKDGDMSFGDWTKIIWQGAQVPTEFGFIAPFKVAFKALDEWSEEVVEPGLAWLSMMDYQTAAEWKRRNPSRSYLEAVNAATWGASERDDPNRVTIGDVYGGNWGRAFGKERSPLDPVQRRMIREDPFTGKVAGVSDFVMPVFFDPMNFAGAPARAATAAGRGALLVSEEVAQKAGVWGSRGVISRQAFTEGLDSGKYAEAIEFIGRTEDDIAGYTTWAANSRLGINDPASFAHLANTVKGEEDAALLLKALVNDAEAGAALKAKYGPGYDLLVKNSLGDDRAWQHAATTGEEVVFDPDLLAGIDEVVTANDTSEVGQRIIRESKEAFARGVDQLTADATRTNITRVLPDETTWLGRREARGQRKRAERAGAGLDRRTFIDEVDESGNTVRVAKLTPYRPTALHPAQWFIERPSGLVRVEQPDSINEILAQIREIDRVTDGAMSAKGYGNWVLEEWTKASTHANPQSARGLVAHKVNQLGISLLAEKHGLTPAQAEQLFKMGTEKSAAALKRFREKGWLALVLDDGSMGILRSPLLQRTTPNSVQMWDIAHLDRYFTRMQSTGFQKVWRVAADGTVGGMDMINSAFKISVLFRLGYTMRNLTEAAWSLAATGNLGHVVSAVGEERLRTLFNPARKTGARLIERVGSAAGILEDRAVQRASYEEKQALLEALNKVREDQVRRLSHIDVKALVMSGDPEQYRLARRVLEMRARLGTEETTWHATNDPAWALDEDRYLSTTGSQVMAIREADKAWQDWSIYQYSPTGQREGLLSPHADIDRGLWGRMPTFWHGGLKWQKGLEDPDARRELLPGGDLNPNPEKWDRSGLIGVGLYSSAGDGVTRQYERAAVQRAEQRLGLSMDQAAELESTRYTVLWKHFRPPKILDADESIRDLPVLLQFIDDYVDDLKHMIFLAESKGLNVDREYWEDLIDSDEFVAKNPEAPAWGAANNNQHLKQGMIEVKNVLDEFGRHGDAAMALVDIDDIMRRRALTKRQKEIVSDIRKAIKADPNMDPADVSDLWDKANLSEPAAFNWHGYSGMTSSVAFVDLMGNSLRASIMRLVREYKADLPNHLPAINDYWERWYGQSYDSWFGQLSATAESKSYRYAKSDPRHQEEVDNWLEQLSSEESVYLTSDAVTRRLRDEGYDAIGHTGGLLGGGSREIHPVLNFINADDVRVVGEDWLDYDNQKVIEAARNMVLFMRAEARKGARVRRINYDRRNLQPGVIADQLPNVDQVGYREVTEQELDEWYSDPTLLAREFGYDPKRDRGQEPRFMRMFQILDPDKVADAKPITTYGRTLDLSISDWRRLPEDVKKAMRWKHHLTGQQPEKGFGINDRVLPGDDLVAAFGEDFKDVHWIPATLLEGIQGNWMPVPRWRRDRTPGRTVAGHTEGLRYNTRPLGRAIAREGFDRNYLVVEYNPDTGAVALGEGNHRLNAVVDHWMQSAKRKASAAIRAGKAPTGTGFADIPMLPVKVVVNRRLDLSEIHGSGVKFNPKKPGVGRPFAETLSREEYFEVMGKAITDYPVPTRTRRKPKKTRARSFTADMGAVRAGDQEVRDEIVGIANALGYDRIVFPDTNAFGGRQIVVNPKFAGEAGLQRRVDEEIRKVEQRVQVPTEYEPEVRTAKSRRAERRAYRANGNPNPSPVIPDFERRLAATMENNGIDAWVEDVMTTRARLEGEADQIAARLASAEARQARWEGAGRPGFGKADVSIRSKFGEDYTLAGPLGGHAGDLWSRMTSSDETNQRIFLPSDRGAMVGGTPAPTTVAPNDPQYFDAWSNILNLHFRDPESKIVDPVVEMFLRGRSPEAVIKWATTTREGYDWANSIGLTKSSTATLSGRGSVKARAEALAEAREKVGTSGKRVDPENIEEAVTALEMAVRLYLPEGPVRDAFLGAGEVTPDLIRSARQGLENSAIHGLLVQTGKEARYNWAWNDYAREGIGKAMRALGSLPETSMMRHPFFATMARDEYVRRIALAEENVGRRLTVKEINQIIHDSRQQAKRDLEKTLYTITRKSGFAESTRFLFPFAAAWENSMRRWGSFVKDDPSLPIRAGLLVTKTMNALPLFDSEGNEISAGDMTPDSYVMLPGLDSLGRFIGGSWGQMLESQAQNVQVPLRSLDLITQGEPGNPGFGPFMLMPISAILKRKPNFDDFLGWTMPYGAPASSLDVFMPTWVRRVKSMYTKDSTYTNAFTSAYLYEMWRYEQGMRDTEPTLPEVEQTTKSFYLLRTLTNLTAPFSVQYSNERDWYVAKLRQYRAAHENQQEAEARFFADFPDAARLVQSLSSNPAGVLATEKAYGNLTKYQQEIAEAYGMGDPKLAGFIANYGHDPQADEFSGAVYSWEREAAPVPGSMDTYRRVANPEEAVRESRIEEGWRQWRSVVEQTEARLQAAGVPVDSPGYETVMTNAKRIAAEAVYATGNQAWWLEYKDPDTSKYFRRATFFENLVSDSKFMADNGKDPLMRSISMYLSLRRRYAEAVQMSAMQGGARSLSGPLGRQWDMTVAQLRADSPEFAAWLDRYFQNDKVVGGEPIPQPRRAA